MRSLVICAALISCGISSASAQEAIRWYHDLPKAQQAAAQSNRLVLIHFVGRNCAPCERLENTVFTQPGFIKALESEFVPVKINGTDMPITAKQYKIEVFPTDVVLTPEGKVVSMTSCPQDATVYTAQVLEIADNYRKHMAVLARMNGGAAANQQAANNARTPVVVGNVQIGESQPVARPQQQVQQPVAYQPNGTTAVGGMPNGAVAGVGVTGQPGVQPGYGQGQNTQGAYAQGGYGQPAQGQPTQGQGAYGQAGVPQNGAAVATTQPNLPYQPVGQTNVAAATPNSQANQVTNPSMTGYRPPSARYQEPQNVAAANAAKAVLGLDGQCPVSLHENNGRKLVPGDARFGAMHRGRLYLFATAAHQQKFFSDPDRYSPMLAGYDPVRWSETGQLVAGKLQYGVFLQDRVYLFADEASLTKFEQESNRFVAPIEQAMRPTGRGTIQR